MNCTSKISLFLEPIREKRKYYEKRIDEVKAILNDGEQRAKKVAEATMNEVHVKMRMG
jgi:tryptophanyl-tRNA synthetase